MGTRLLIPLTALFCLGLQAQDSIPTDTASGANCTFKSNPSKFLDHQSRTYAGIRNTLSTLDKTRKMSAAAGQPATLDPSMAPRTGFIDDEIFNAMTAAGAQAAPISGDEEFFRRINLDLVGRTPVSSDIRAFEADTNPNKRAALIDKLLASDAFNDKWTMWLGDLVQNNVTAVAFNRNVNGRNAFYNYLFSAIKNSKPFNELAYELVTGTGNNYNSPGVAGFMLNGLTSGGPTQDTYDMMLVKTASTFLGMSHYDCLNCHNGRGHLDALSLWGSQSTRTQAEQMSAFFARTRWTGYSFPTGTSTADQQASFYYQSEFVSDATSGTYALPTTYGNRPNRPLLGTLTSVAPLYRTGQTAGTNNWRAEFATNMVSDPLFSINFVNRVWKAMFNLGQVDSVDTLDPARLDPNNPPPDPWAMQALHPVLLQKLASEFTNDNYDLRSILRLIANSSAYQLSSTYPGTWDSSTVGLFTRHYPRRLMGEEVHDAIAQATGVFFKYTPRGFTTTVQWAMQMPDTSEPASNNNNALTFMGYFLRGNRDNVGRAQDPTILQSGALMNDTFINGKMHMTQSPVLQAVAKLTTPAAQLQEMYLTFLGRVPTTAESAVALPFLTTATTTTARNAALEDLGWALMNKLEFVFSY